MYNDAEVCNGNTVTERKNMDIENNFTYHPPKAGQPERCARIRGEAKKLATLLMAECPDSREKSIAFTKLEEVVMWANASIARNE